MKIHRLKYISYVHSSCNQLMTDEVVRTRSLYWSKRCKYCKSEGGSCKHGNEVVSDGSARDKWLRGRFDRVGRQTQMGGKWPFGRLGIVFLLDPHTRIQCILRTYTVVI